ncbi:ribonuclease E inhibitor RraB [Litoreibacter albidus]|uniref:Regulator of ribonuclease activity B n=1 Tax=Litoreibacter albidus TaxID=670155 RepID=A0A1H2XJQ6_9RHOB|nr:ribonuclease E inhibitor RraB [Litoreibacter albidus]SDW93085.1 Regulator of ribonuclease activity B [Litoreibacter albidus]
MIKDLLNSIVARFRRPLELGSAKANQLVLDQIAEQGDDGTEDRHVRHFAYPKRGAQPAGRDRAVDLFAEAGLEVSDTQYHNGLMGEHHVPVATDEFNQLTNGLREEFARMGWEYDGWECAVLKS